MAEEQPTQTPSYQEIAMNQLEASLEISKRECDIIKEELQVMKEMKDEFRQLNITLSSILRVLAQSVHMTAVANEKMLGINSYTLQPVIPKKTEEEQKKEDTIAESNKVKLGVGVPGGRGNVNPPVDPEKVEVKVDKQVEEEIQQFEDACKTSESRVTEVKVEGAKSGHEVEVTLTKKKPKYSLYTSHYDDPKTGIDIVHLCQQESESKQHQIRCMYYLWKSLNIFTYFHCCSIKMKRLSTTSYLLFSHKPLTFLLIRVRSHLFSCVLHHSASEDLAIEILGCHCDRSLAVRTREHITVQFLQETQTILLLCCGNRFGGIQPEKLRCRVVHFFLKL